MASNLRQNPFTRAFSWERITGETSTVALFPHLPSVYGVILKEIPRPESVVIKFTNPTGSVTIVNNSPLANQARIDYQRGHVVFNSSDNAKTLTINYEGGGTVLSLDNLEAFIQEVGDARYRRLLSGG